MLNKDTKNIIQNARDILVGKVPNPISQVDLITTAMIYKFMDDMDMQNIEFVGKRVFFTGDLEPYAWSKLLLPKVGHHDRLALYSEALDKLQVAEQIPDLFRRIFKEAFLPFRDGQTLSLFLNEINQLTYDNSENLGDAFEFLLSVMGAQGDAGQFRTPRHIIDFIVDVVNPSKTDTILDPACGTAGFLISAYKHIINKAQTEKKLLTPVEMKTLTENICGYDISPDMVKLASVNLFLHQFPKPHISEYDTLTYEDKWQDKYDVILANPPFMTPKGGIMPHNKFSIKATKAEVLFVDYFIEHLTINGKAGFIVPEGIIFQSGKAYQKLRETMIKDHYLYAVVSLPSGVFNPYSGVKTSILFFDRALAKKSKDILFVKIDNDGFDLGAQRREIKENDIPNAIQTIKAYQQYLEAGKEFDVAQYSKCLLVSKDKIKENGDYNLTASRYEETKDYINCKYEMVKLGDIIEYEQPTKYIVESVEYKDEYKIPVLTAGQSFILGYTNENNNVYNRLPVIIFDDFTTANKFVDFPFKVKSSAMKMLQTKNKDISNLRYTYYMMQNIKFNSKTHKRYWISEYSNIEIPLPPLEVQEEIVRELDGYQAIIDGAQKVVDNWKPTFTINPNWEKVKLGDIAKISSGNSAPQDMKLFENGLYPFCRTSDVGKVHLSSSLVDISDKLNEEGRQNLALFPKGTILFPKSGASILLNHRVMLGVDSYVSSHLATINGNKNVVLQEYLYYLLQYIDAKTLVPDNGYPSLKVSVISNIEIPLPSLEEQKAIVAKIEQEEQYVEACKKLIELNKQKIADKIKSIWNSGE